MISFLTEHLNSIISLVAVTAMTAAAYFAYRSARMSEVSNKAQFSPFLLPYYINYFKEGLHRTNSEPSKSNLMVDLENRTEYKNAFAKNIVAKIDGVSIWKTSSLGPGDQDRFSVPDISSDKVLGKTLTIEYQDILGNKFETKCQLAEKTGYEKEAEKDSPHVSFKWSYKQN